MSFFSISTPKGEGGASDLLSRQRADEKSRLADSKVHRVAMFFIIIARGY